MKENGVLRTDKGRFEGEFQDNMKNGKGTFIYKNGQVYVGEFLRNKRHGYGNLFNEYGKITK